MFTAATPEAIRYFQLCHLKARLKMEIRGLTGHGRTAYSQAKDFIPCKGNRQKVLDRLEYEIDLALDRKKFSGVGLYNCCTDFKPPQWTDFTWFEIQPCRHIVYSAEDQICEPIMEHNELHEVVMWTVYGRLHDGGVMAITDTTTEALAIAISHKFFEDHGQEMRVAQVLREANGKTLH